MTQKKLNLDDIPIGSMIEVGGYQENNELEPILFIVTKTEYVPPGDNGLPVDGAYLIELFRVDTGKYVTDVLLSELEYWYNKTYVTIIHKGDSNV